MTKEFKISEILKAVDNLSKIKKVRNSPLETKLNLVDKEDVLTLNNELKSDKSEILVLNQMIE